MSKTSEKFQQLRAEPEEVRLRAATRLSIIIGVILVLVILAILLPLQIYFN